MVQEWVLGTMTMASFTPDRRALVICRGDSLTCWDVHTLHPIRRLDRNWPEFPPVDRKKQKSELAKIEILPGDLAKPVLTREQKARETIEQYRLEVKAQPDNPESQNELAWIYLTAPAALRDVKAAV